MDATNNPGKSPIVKAVCSPVLLVDIVLIALGIVFLLESRNIRPGFQQALDARVYPRAVAVIVVAALILHFVQTFRKEWQSRRRSIKSRLDAQSAPRIASEARVRLVSVLALFIAYILVIRRVGYFESGYLFLVGSMIALGERTFGWIVRSVFIALAITAAVYLVFGVFLRVYVPPGILLR